VCCSVLQCVASCCNVLQCVSLSFLTSHTAPRCNTHCNTLHHTAPHCTHCTALQHTLPLHHTTCHLRPVTSWQVVCCKWQVVCCKWQVVCCKWQVVCCKWQVVCCIVCVAVCVAVCCSVVQCVGTWHVARGRKWQVVRGKLASATWRRSVSQYLAVSGSVLQYVAVCVTVLQWCVTWQVGSVLASRQVPRGVAACLVVCCSVLQCVSLCCSGVLLSKSASATWQRVRDLTRMATCERSHTGLSQHPAWDIDEDVRERISIDYGPRLHPTQGVSHAGGQ